jgi:hypothetical protein
MFSGPAHHVNIVLESYCKRRKIRFIEGNAKCHLKIYLLRDFAAGFYLSEAQNHIVPPLHTVYVYTIYLFTQKRGAWGRVEPKRRGERGNS